MSVVLAAPSCPFTGHVQRTLRRVGLGIRAAWRQRAGHEHHQRLVVPELVQRQIGDLGGPQFGVHVGLVRLQEFGSDLTVMVSVRVPTASVKSTRLIWPTVDWHAGSNGFLEPLQRDLHVVGSGRHVRERIARPGYRLSSRG